MRLCHCVREHFESGRLMKLIGELRGQSAVLSVMEMIGEGTLVAICDSIH